MKKLLDRILDWKRPYCQLVLTIVIFVGVIYFHGAARLASLLVTGETKESIYTVLYFVLVRFGDPAVALAVLVVLLKHFKSSNNEEVLNSGNHYHDHLYVLYWICSKVLGYRKCRLILVPVPMQFKLVVRDTFPVYLYDEGTHEIDEETDKVKVSKKMTKDITREVNLIIADTYPIESEHLPKYVKELTTIKIDRSIKDDKTRYQSENLIKTTITEVRNISDKVETVNLFGTLNSYHCYRIAKEVFVMGGRATIKHLVIYPQTMNGWRFEDRGIRIY